jgi:hypothetical protein
LGKPNYGFKKYLREQAKKKKKEEKKRRKLEKKHIGDGVEENITEDNAESEGEEEN